MIKQVIPTVRADISVLKDKKVKAIFNDIVRHKAHTPEEITNELNLERSVVLTSLQTLVDAELIAPTSSLPTASGTMTFYSPSREGIKLMRAIEGGYDISIRIAFGFVAWSILSATNLFDVNYIQGIILLPLFSVLASITTLQNFAINVGYKNIDLSSMFDQFKQNFVNEIIDKESEKNEQISKERALNAYNLIDNLAEKVPLETLRSECTFVLQDFYNRDLKSFDPAMNEAKKQVKECESASTNDQILLKKLFASKIFS